ncbi:MAG: helix-turn-helix transcriptional regulator [Eubacteriaceae bacterium]|nr:helix-turn-helix transcriptional regulator [Eubacteriaceae bacterium]
MPIRVKLDEVMASRKVGVAELAERIEITPANLSVLKNGRAKAIRFSTLSKICEALGCSPADILVYEPDGVEE